MKCDLCGRTFFQETSLNNLFQKKHYCIECKILMDLDIQKTSIPFNGGVLDIYVLFPGVILKESIVLNIQEKYRKALNMAFFNNDNKPLILYVDDYEWQTFNKWFSYIKFSSNIVFLSLVDFAYEHFVKKM